MTKVTILGTGSPEAMPVLFDKDQTTSRLRPSMLIEHENVVLLFDSSPDIRQQLLKSKVDHLDAVFITHHHFDHFWGIGDLDQLHWVGKDNFKVYCPESTKKNVDEHLSWLSLNFIVIKEKMNFQDLSVTPFKIKHSSYLDMYGYIIEANNKKIIYAPDLLDVEKKELEKTLDADLLIADGQYILGKYIEDEDHAGGEKLCSLIDSFKAKKVWLVAYSEYWYKLSAEEATKKLNKKYCIPNDFDSIEF